MKAHAVVVCGCRSEVRQTVIFNIHSFYMTSEGSERQTDRQTTLVITSGGSAREISMWHTKSKIGFLWYVLLENCLSAVVFWFFSLVTQWMQQLEQVAGSDADADNKLSATVLNSCKCWSLSTSYFCLKKRRR